MTPKGKVCTPLLLASGAYRIHTQVIGDRYLLNMGEYIHELSNEELPDEIKVCLGFINAHDWVNIHKKTELDTERGKSVVQYHFNKEYPEILTDIGWRIGDTYCLVLSNELVIKLIKNRTRVRKVIK